MSSIPWIRRDRRFDRRVTPGTPDRHRQLDGWLDTLHQLAQRRAAERASLADTGRAMRARLRRAE